MAKTKKIRPLHYLLLVLLFVSAALIFMVTLVTMRASEFGRMVDFPVISLLILLFAVSTLVGLVLYPILE
jgi:hypothetical protein